MSQKEAILKYLKAGHSLTGIEALRLFGTIRLASRISELKKDGVDVMQQMINVNQKWIAKYFLIPEA